MSLFLTCLGLTLLLEAPFYLFLLSHRSKSERVAFWLAANIYSYPPVFYIFPYLALPAWGREMGAEIWAPLCEIAVGAYILKRFSRRDGAVVILANLFSWLVGRLLI